MDDMDLGEVHAKKCPEIVDGKDDFHLFQAAPCLNRGRLRLANACNWLGYSLPSANFPKIPNNLAKRIIFAKTFCYSSYLDLKASYTLGVAACQDASHDQNYYLFSRGPNLNLHFPLESWQGAHTQRWLPENTALADACARTLSFTQSVQVLKVPWWFYSWSTFTSGLINHWFPF